MKKIIGLLMFLLVGTSLSVFANPRSVIGINQSWRFAKADIPDAKNKNFDDSQWDIISIPHTWNAVDVTDDVPGYYRGTGWYRRSIFIPEDNSKKRVTIFFEGANQETELFINGEKVGEHVGGYTRFSFNITDFIRFGENNQFAIKVNNKHNADIPPLSGDFTFFGGIYRDVYLIYTNDLHISTTHYASSGVYLSTPEVNEKEASLNVRTILNNAGQKERQVIVEHSILDADKNIVRKISEKIKLPKRNNIENTQKTTITSPHLWSPESPYLYSVYSRIYDAKSKELLDEVFEPLGFRWFEFTAEKGFKLNGKKYKLIGTSRHQCYDGKGNALTDDMHVRDAVLLKEMGGNFLRISHYPQDPVVLEMCDKLGIITSIEIPIVDGITPNENFVRNSMEMTKEMVLQDYNRPSCVIWAYMNEVLLHIPSGDEPGFREKYIGSVHKLATGIEAEIRSLDPYRYTMIPFHGNFNDYHNSGLTRIPMIVGWNLYQGWYTGEFSGFDQFLKDSQYKLKGIPFIVTEYGADVDPRLHSFEPQRFDYTAEWANLYHEHYLKTIMERPYVVGANIWNLNDFHSEGRANAVPHINNKGITSITRQPKDTYLLYKAFLNKQPVVLIGGADWKLRGGNVSTGYTCTQPVKVYSNLPEIELMINSKSLCKQIVKDNIAQFDVPFSSGENRLEAVGISNDGEQVRDLQHIQFHAIPSDLKDKNLPFSDMNIMLGSKRYFQDLTKGLIWLPEKEYSAGSWGYVGGTSYVVQARHGGLPASELDIWGTTNDPVYQTARIGIQNFKADVPDGQYTITLYWAELQASQKKTLAYNLGNDANADIFDGRIFDVSINGKEVVHHLDLVAQYGAQRAVEMKFIINVSNGDGIDVMFKPQKGESILNAIRIYRNY